MATDGWRENGVHSTFIPVTLGQAIASRVQCWPPIETPLCLRQPQSSTYYLIRQPNAVSFAVSDTEKPRISQSLFTNS